MVGLRKRDADGVAVVPKLKPSSGTATPAAKSKIASKPKRRKNSEGKRKGRVGRPPKSTTTKPLKRAKTADARNDADPVMSPDFTGIDSLLVEQKYSFGTRLLKEFEGTKCDSWF